MTKCHLTKVVKSSFEDCVYQINLKYLTKEFAGISNISHKKWDRSLINLKCCCHFPDFGRVVGFQYKLPSKSYAVFHLPGSRDHIEHEPLLNQSPSSVTTDYNSLYSPYQPSSILPYLRQTPTEFSPATAIFRN